MDADVFATALALLAVVAALATIVVVAGRVLGRPSWVPDGEVALVGAFGIAAVATAGSLIFSEVYHFTPASCAGSSASPCTRWP